MSGINLIRSKHLTRPARETKKLLHRSGFLTSVGLIERPLVAHSGPWQDRVELAVSGRTLLKGDTHENPKSGF